jgi:hypothetical protein
MSLTVEPPESPDLTNRALPPGLEDSDAVGSESDLYRDELEAWLRDGAWAEAFSEWAEFTDLSVETFRALQSAGVVDGLDFYWDPVEERLRFAVPDLPPALVEDEERVDTRAELEDLCETVLDALEDGYVDRDGFTVDDTWSDETFDDDVEPDD